jgi:AcrR family transcriptional regulator
VAERRDARRNRAALLTAARAVLIARGMDAPMKSIASAAGLGTATLYRHFPTRADLIAAVFADELEHCRTELAEACTFQDPWDALRHLLYAVADTEMSLPGVAELLSRSGVSIPAYDAVWAEARDVIDSLPDRLRQAGARHDLHRDDLWLMLGAVRSTVAGRRPTKDHTSSRLITLMVEGARQS